MPDFRNDFVGGDKPVKRMVKKTIAAWYLNIYPNMIPSIHRTKTIADARANCDRIACEKVGPWEIEVEEDEDEDEED